MVNVLRELLSEFSSELLYEVLSGLQNYNSQ
jgi:hypothetical protein